jgi:hypothetical protein
MADLIAAASGDELAPPDHFGSILHAALLLNSDCEDRDLAIDFPSLEVRNGIRQRNTTNVHQPAFVPSIIQVVGI